MKMPMDDKKFNRELITAKTHNAICVGFFDMGRWENDYQGVKSEVTKVLIRFEVSEEETQGELKGNHKCINAWFNKSLGDKSNLKPFLESLQGHAFTAKEVKEIDTDDFIGKPCLLTVGVKNEKNYIVSVSALPDEMTELMPDKLFTSTEEPDWVEKSRKKSSLYGKGTLIEAPAPEAEEDSTIPF